jgi:response regulator RpfG family c-di-GMP phosphodiesterase
MRSSRAGSVFCTPAEPAAQGWSPTNEDIHSSNPLLLQLLAASVVVTEDWLSLPDTVQDEIDEAAGEDATLAKLVENGLVTPYQAERVSGGNAFGLVLGNYRVLDRLSIGGMGVVFKGEHVHMRRPVAIKAMAVYPDQDPIALRRFYGEVRALAQLQHPHIVAALDSGFLPSPDPGFPGVQYFVMEYVPGHDLEEYIETRGPLAPAKACDLIYQIASALGEAHRRGVIHRDIKPSNVRLTPDGVAKLVDFGLALRFRNRLTEPGMVLGTLDYLAPEQARDASAVDGRADIYGLGGTLFWSLTGRCPFAPCGSVAEAVLARLTQPPPSVRALRPELPAELDAIVARMLAVNPNDRYPDAQTVQRALHAFLQAESLDPVALPALAAEQRQALAEGGEPFGRPQRVLIADDEPQIRLICRYALQSEEVACDEAVNGAQALAAIHAGRYDLVLLDIDMPEMRGTEVLRRLRQAPPYPHLKVVMFSGRATADEMAEMLLAGADDYLAKPFSNVQLAARVKAALRLKDLQDRADVQSRKLLLAHSVQGEMLSARESDLVHTRNALVLALAKLVGYRRNDSSARLLRLRRYTRSLAEEAAAAPAFGGQIDPGFIRCLDYSVPLYDIGMVVLPDHVLRSPGKLEFDETLLFHSHTTIGAEILAEVAKEHGSAMDFLQMAVELARHHHERWDGTGYPDRLSGPRIPLAARLVALADAYDSLRSRQPSKPPLAHAAAVSVITDGSQGHFDPDLLQVFRRCAPQFERIFRELPG